MTDSEGKNFSMGTGFKFAVSVPDDTVGISGSRCSSCGEKGAYCHQICRSCGLPFIGPFDFPQWEIWQQTSVEGRQILVEEVYCHITNHGRLLFDNVLQFPLTHKELRKVEGQSPHDANYFFSAHGVHPKDIRKKLKV